MHKRSFHITLSRRDLILGLGAATLGALVLPTEASAAPIKSRVVDAYRGKRGTTLTLKLKEAPFPSRGSRWRDPTTIVFVPHHYRQPKSGKVDTIVHFHGHSSTAESAMKYHQLREQLYDSKQNAILVMPQGPVKASSGDGGKLDKPGGLVRFLGDVRRTLQSRGARKHLKRSRISGKARIGNLCLSAHSGGYRVVAQCLKHGGFNVNEVYLFDALYGDAAIYAKWIAERKSSDGRDRHKLICYYGGGKVAAQSRRLMGMLKKSGIDYLHEKKEGSLSRAQFTKGRVIFVRTKVGHRSATYVHNTFRDCLFGSCLKRRLNSAWFSRKDKERRLERRTPE